MRDRMSGGGRGEIIRDRALELMKRARKVCKHKNGVSVDTHTQNKGGGIKHHTERPHMKSMTPSQTEIITHSLSWLFKICYSKADVETRVP